MKIRNGHVSNSSSSSFIIALDKIPGSISDVKNILFGDKSSEYIFCQYDYLATVDQISSVIFDDIQENIDNNVDVDELTELFLIRYSLLEYCFYHDDYLFVNNKMKEKWERQMDMVSKSRYNSSNNMNYKEYDEQYEKLLDIGRESARYDVQKFLDDNKGRKIIVLEYEDKTSIGCIIEHGNMFSRVNHLRISNH